MKKRMIILCGLLTAALLMTGCGQKGSTGSGNGAASSQTSDSGQAAPDDGSDDASGSDEQDEASDDVVVSDDQAAEGMDAGDSDDENNEDGAVSDSWTGTFNCASGESVSITLEEPETFSFSFASSGIAGQASVSGDTAVFHGEDNYTVTFSLSGDTLTVSSTDGENEGSAMDGTYDRQ
ncbi:MAG: hypothetical protein K6C06_00225 [Lachnospiraceae bacterium]|nr:hypothetical protein [Lachnospiraceae bacterium]